MKGLSPVRAAHDRGITINENTDPNVRRDIPSARAHGAGERRYLHAEGNSAHILPAWSVARRWRSSRTTLVLGAWQAIYLCEFDGPRTRTVLIRVLPE
jgi:thiamine phosphate synthase YjbQ (UPF0047 family)